MGAHPISKCGDIHSHSGRINTQRYRKLPFSTAFPSGVVATLGIGEMLLPLSLLLPTLLPGSVLGSF